MKMPQSCVLPGRVNGCLYQNVCGQDVRGGSANWVFAHGNGRFRLRQHGTFSFSQKCGTMCHIFVKKIWVFRPAGGVSFQGTDRKSCCGEELRGGHSNRTFAQMEARFACGSMVLLFSFSQKNSHSEFFCENDLVTSALPAAKCSAGSVTA
jgi:hypothetical protein